MQHGSALTEFERGTFHGTYTPSVAELKALARRHTTQPQPLQQSSRKQPQPQVTRCVMR